MNTIKNVKQKDVRRRKCSKDYTATKTNSTATENGQSGQQKHQYGSFVSISKRHAYKKMNRMFIHSFLEILETDVFKEKLQIGHLDRVKVISSIQE